MNKELFLLLMGAVDSDLLEEAQLPVKKIRQWPRMLGIVAACLAVVISVYFLKPLVGERFPGTEDPIHKVTLAEIQQLGYSLPVPGGAQGVSYALVDSSSGDTPMAEVTYTSGGRTYSCRALKTQQVQDISGMEQEWTQSLDWKAGTLQMQMRQSDTDAWVGWYAPDAGVQWCLSGGEDALSLLHTAQDLLETLGYGVAVAPEGAEDLLYNAFALNGLVVGETEFTLNGVRCSYRMAQTYEIAEDFADISGMDGSFQNESACEIAWCPARLSFDDGGAGKIVWFDVVPGLLYSLSMDRDASEEALLEMANQMFAPAQGDVG